MNDIDNPNIPAELAAIHARLESGEARFAALEKAVVENTRITKESGEIITDVRDALIFARVGTRIVKGLGALGTAAAAVVTIWITWRKQ